MWAMLMINYGKQTHGTQYNAAALEQFRLDFVKQLIESWMQSDLLYHIASE